MKLDSRHMSGVSLQGDIAAIELNNVFQFLHYASLSGELRVVTEHNNGSFFFQRGVLVFGALSIHQKRIGDLLVESGFITEAQLMQCLKIHAKHRRRQRLGDILVKKGFLKFESLSEALKVQAREAFFETLRWKQGMFFFYINQYPSKEEILINERIDHMILEGLVRIDDSQAAEESANTSKEDS